LQPGLIFVQPRTGFQVASVHSIEDVSAIIFAFYSPRTDYRDLASNARDTTKTTRLNTPEVLLDEITVPLLVPPLPAGGTDDLAWENRLTQDSPFDCTTTEPAVVPLYNDESASDESIEKVNEPEGGFGVGRERR
jgi:hypothetical protein